MDIESALLTMYYIKAAKPFRGNGHTYTLLQHIPLDDGGWLEIEGNMYRRISSSEYNEMTTWGVSEWVICK